LTFDNEEQNHQCCKCTKQEGVIPHKLEPTFHNSPNYNFKIAKSIAHKYGDQNHRFKG